MKKKILIADDESSIRELLHFHLKKEGFKVETAKNGMEAVEKAGEFKPDLILMDFMMPVMNGDEACKKIKETQAEAHIIFLTARQEEVSEIAAFEAGADDYIVKPVKIYALISRLKSFFKKNNTAEEQALLKFDTLVLDKTSHQVLLDDEEIHLTKKEFKLLFYLASRPNQLFNRDELLEKIWGNEVYVIPRTVDVHIRKIREKIGENFIMTIKGVGYKFIPSEEKK